MTRRTRIQLAQMAMLAALGASWAAIGAEYSALWGRAGEQWSPESRLPDFSFAGYRRGEEPFRVPASQVAVTAFGAKGDERADDTAAFQRAIAEGEGKLIVIPPGRFILSDALEIRGSRRVLRGAGSERTTLVFTKPLEELRPRPAKTDGNQPTTQWSWGGGLIIVGQRRKDPAFAVSVVAEARRGALQLSLAQPRFKPGDEVELEVRDDADKSLVKYLYRGQEGDASGLKNWTCRQVFRVRAVSGNTVTLDRPLRFDARPAWKPVLAPFAPLVTDVGLEGLAFEFPATPYGGHFKELGFNPVVIESGAAHCWLRDLKIWNADSGPYVNGSFCTLSGLRLGADPGRKSAQGHTGHHGLTFYGHDNLCTNFVLETQFIHDATVQSAMGCVYCAGRAVNLCLDHHRWAPYENLFTDLDAGEGTRLFSSSGGGFRGAHTAAGATFWNIRTAQPVGWPKNLGIDAINVVGVNSKSPPETHPQGRWFEPIPPAQLRPANLYGAMLEKRRQGAAPAGP